MAKKTEDKKSASEASKTMRDQKSSKEEKSAAAKTMSDKSSKRKGK
ncbi:MAG TPA: hypothetical protein VK179_07250 [Bacteroidales bacterium]|nr:hypothetical protein [Bacteroidales bacterium]